MNSLSWLIYAIGAIDKLSIVLLVLTLLLPLAALGWMAISSVSVSENSYSWSKAEVRERWEARRDAAAKKIAPALVTAVCLALLQTVIPSRQTMLLIAGSEIGQRVAQSETVLSIVEPGADLLRTWIAEETKRLKGGKDK